MADNFFKNIANQSLTFFQRAGEALDKTANGAIEKAQEQQYLTAASVQDAEKQSVEKKAVNYFGKQARNINKANDQRTLIYEANRIHLYHDYVAMAAYPTLGAALELLAEESTTTKSDNGQILNIFASSDKVKRELERLFYRVIDININLTQWCMDMCQYGDNFIFLNLSDEKGVTGVRKLSTLSIERDEREDSKGRYRAYFKYRDPAGGSSEEEFLDFQVAHFRLLGDSNRLPYGSSVFEKVRRTYKQLFMMEDAMLVYRITRAPERRIFKVPVGNIPPEDIPAVIQSFASQVKTKRLVDPHTGDINFRFNIASMDEDIFVPDRGDGKTNFIDTLPGACLALNTRIPLLDGRTLELNEIIDEFNEGKELWAYSINPNTGEVVSSPISWAGVTRKNTEVIKLHLSNGKFLVCTPDHKIFCKSKKELLQAKDFEINDIFWNFVETKDDIHLIYDHKLNLWKSNDELRNYWKNTFEGYMLYKFDNNLENVFLTEIEYLNETIDTGTLTIDGHEKYHNYHNFALASGIFVNNSNLSAIEDINYLRDNLFVGLGIHKTLLGFSSDSAPGDGKNLSMLDIRFARKINRIQQALLSELNKIAVIHLAMLGGDYAQYIEDFKLSLNNPSTASDLLKLEIEDKKTDVYLKLTTPNSTTGIKPMSELNAKKKIYNMSEEDILNDLQEQFIESKIGNEIKNADLLVKSSGFMDKVIKYKNAGFNPEDPKNQQGQQQGDMMGDMGGGGFGGGMPPMGGPTDLGNGTQVPGQGGMGGMGGEPSQPAITNSGSNGFLSEEVLKNIDDLLKE